MPTVAAISERLGRGRAFTKYQWICVRWAMAATGVVMSVRNSKGRVLLHTEPGHRWQVYQPTK